MSKELDKLIEKVLNEKLNIQFDSTKGFEDVRTKLGVDKKDLPYKKSKNPKSPVYKVDPSDTFNYDDTQAISVDGEGRIKNTGDNKSLLQVFLGTTVWNQMDEDEQEQFTNDYLILKNYGILKTVSNFFKHHKEKYEELTNLYKRANPNTPIAQTAVPDPSVTAQTIQTGLADKKQLKQEEKDIFDQFFALNKATTLSDRLKALTNFSLLISSPAQKGAEKQKIKTILQGNATGTGGQVDLPTLTRNFIVNTSVLDIFNNFAKNIDHGAGAYYFEGFLAYMSAGQAGGKEMGAAGGMGVADFIKADGSKGSAKFLKPTTAITQSWKNFIDGDPVEYIIAQKFDAEGGDISDIEKLYRIELYSLTVEAVDPTKVKLNGKEYNVQEYLSGDSIDLKVAQKLWTSLGNFYMPQTNQKTLAAFLKEGAGFIDKAVDKGFEEFKKVMDDLKFIKSKTLSYSSTGTAATAKDALDRIPDYQTNLKALGTSYGQNLEESKTSLDNLIEAIIKQKLLK